MRAISQKRAFTSSKGRTLYAISLSTLYLSLSLVYIYYIYTWYTHNHRRMNRKKKKMSVVLFVRSRDKLPPYRRPTISMVISPSNVESHSPSPPPPSPRLACDLFTILIIITRHTTTPPRSDRKHRRAIDNNRSAEKTVYDFVKTIHFIIETYLYT